MSTMNNGTSWNSSITINKQTGTKATLSTANTYVNKNIELTLNVKTATPTFEGGYLNNKNASASFTNMTTSTENTSGVIISTKGTAGRDALFYNMPIDGWVSKNNGTIASESISASNWNGTTYYATGVTLTNGKSFDITVPNGSEQTITFHFSVDSNGNTTIT